MHSISNALICSRAPGCSQTTWVKYAAEFTQQSSSLAFTFIYAEALSTWSFCLWNWGRSRVRVDFWPDGVGRDSEVSGSWLSLLSYSPWDCRQYYRTHTHAHTWRAASNYTLNLIRVYVYGSEHMWPPLFLHLPICLTSFLSIRISACCLLVWLSSTL